MLLDFSDRTRTGISKLISRCAEPTELEERLHAVLVRCQCLHVTLSRSKFQISTKLKFAGCVVSQTGVQPDPDRIACMANFPTPQDQTSVRSSLGLCSQLVFFVPDY